MKIKLEIMDKLEYIKLMTWNANGIYNKRNDLEELLYRDRIDICLISETKLNNNKNVKFINYNCYRRDRLADNAGGGVMILVNKKYNNSEKIINPSKAYVNDTMEYIAIKLNKITYIAVYIAPNIVINSNDIDKLFKMGSSVILGGDFNAKHQAWGNVNNNRSGRTLLNYLINSSNCKADIQFPNEHTHYSALGAKGTTIDFFLTKNIKCNKPYACNELNSDHLPVIMKVNMNKVTNSNNNNFKLSKLNYNKTDWNSYRSELNKNWTIVNKFDNKHAIDQTINSLTLIMRKALNTATPKWKNINYFRDMNPKIRELIHIRNKLRKSYQKWPCNECKKEINLYNNRIKYELYKFRNEQYKKYAQDLDIKNGSLWNAVKMSKYSKNTTKHIINKIHDSNGINTNIKEIPNIFADYFESVHHITKDYRYDEHNNMIRNKYYEITQGINNTTLTTFTIRATEIKDIIRQLKNKKSPGIDLLSNIQIKNISNKIIAQLIYIYNDCIRKKYFPNIWKIAKVIAVPKPNKDATYPQNYRPISLLNSFAKMFEKIIANRINKYLKKQKIIIDEQYGFRPGKCTTRQLVRVIYSIINNYNKYKHTSTVLLDIEKAFDTVWHEAIIYKMYLEKIPMDLILLVDSYLTERKFIVELNGHSSNPKNVSAGVPQGSVLGPLLFIIYINDMPKCSMSTLALFADDTAIINFSGKHKILMDKSIESIKLIYEYFYKWKIKPNINKTEILISNWNNRLSTQEIVINDQKISSKKFVRYLGVQLDANLNFTEHIKQIVIKAKIAISILYKLLNNKHINLNLKILVYKMCIRPIMLYACPAWCNTNIWNIKKLQRVQNRCLNIILRNYKFNSEYLRINECHEITKLEYIDEIIAKISKNFYINLVKDIKIVKDFGINSANIAWDRKMWPHQKFFPAQ